MIGALLGSGVILYKWGSWFFSGFKDIFSDFQERREAAQKLEELLKDLELKGIKREIEIREKTGCQWYKDVCPGGFRNNLSPINGKKFKVEGEKLGLIFMKTSIGESSLGPTTILSCCKYYYPQTETAIDWGTVECSWEGVAGDCVPEQAVIAPLGEEGLLCKMDPQSPLANTLIRRCVKNAKTYYWCCPE